MDRFIRIVSVSFVAFLAFGLISGCSQSVSSGAGDSSASVADHPTTDNPATDAIARAAADFLDAVLKGDTQRASARLTPEAIQRIINSGKQFAPPGLETATFRIGQVRAPAEGQAIVQCVLTDTTNGEAPRNEEMCCLMRQVDNDWRVSGIAYGTGPDQPWTLSNFETGQNMAIPRPTETQTASAPPDSEPSATPASRPSPPRTAQDPVPVVR